ncbi:MAG: pilus assembly FimT family protein [Myxococcota bacterium]
MAGAPGQRPALRDRRRGAFTLIEILAVVTILALVATFVAPNVGALRERRLRAEAQNLVAQLELARQRTVVTGVPHRVLFDLEDAGYRLEWLGEASSHIPPPLDLEALDVRGGTPLPLAAPERAPVEFQPIPGMLGRFVWLAEPVFFAGLETPEGWIERGDGFIQFARDGTAPHTEIVIEDDTGRQVVLAVLPLDDAVRWVDEDA